MSDRLPLSVTALLARCPFVVAPLRDYARLDETDFELATIVYGGVAQLLIEGRLPASQADMVFAWINDLAEQGTDDEVLGTGAVELFNDSPAAQQLARAKLTGKALAMLEQYRVSWGQPDYGPVQ